MLFYGRSGGLCGCLYLVEVGELCLTLNDYATLVQAFGLDGIQYMIIRGVAAGA